MTERAPSFFASIDHEKNESDSLEKLEQFDAKLHELVHMHIERGDFFPLLATYLGVLEETAAAPESVPAEVREKQTQLCRSMRESLRQLADTHHILPKAA